MRQAAAELISLLQRNVMLMHSLILGELAYANLRNRTSLINLWQRLPQIAIVTDSEAKHFINIHSLTGRGIDFIDVHLVRVLTLEQGLGSGHAING